MSRATSALIIFCGLVAYCAAGTVRTYHRAMVERDAAIRERDQARSAVSECLASHTSYALARQWRLAYETLKAGQEAVPPPK